MTDAPPGEPSADPRDALIREQAPLIAAQAEQIAALETVVAGLREQLERAENKKRGKQPGSPGASLTWEVPDRTGVTIRGRLPVRPGSGRCC